jgi:hypothetical protein
MNDTAAEAFYSGIWIKTARKAAAAVDSFQPSLDLRGGMRARNMLAGGWQKGVKCPEQAKGMDMQKKSNAEAFFAVTVHREHCVQLEKLISGATDVVNKTKLKVLLNHERQLLNSSQKRCDKYRA